MTPRALIAASLLFAAGLVVAVVIGRALDPTTGILVGYVCGVLAGAVGVVVLNWRE